MAESKKPPQLIINPEMLDSLEEDLTIEQIGKLFLGIRDYYRHGGKIDTGDKLVNIALRPFVNFLDTNNKKYNEKVEKRRQAGLQGNKKRWGEQNIANATDATNVLANIANATDATELSQKSLNIDINKNLNINQNLNVDVDVNSIVATTTTDPFWVIQKWNGMAREYGLPKAFNIPETKQAICDVLNFCVSHLGYKSGKDAVNAIFDKITASSYCIEHKANVQWVFDKFTVVKLLQGNYDNANPSIRPTAKMRDAAMNAETLKLQSEIDCEALARQYQSQSENNL